MKLASSARKLMFFVIFLLLLPAIYSASIDLTVDNTIFESDLETGFLLVSNTDVFNGVVELSYSNIQSDTGNVNFVITEFQGSGPYIFSHEWDLYGIDEGGYVITATLKDLDNNILDTDVVTGMVESSDPVIESSSPSGVVGSTSTTLKVVTDEESICRYDTSDKNYDDMGGEFKKISLYIYEKIISDLNEGVHKYYVRCADLNGNKMDYSELIEFSVDLPPNAEIFLSDESPIKEGTIKVTVKTNEWVEEAPELHYSFNDNPNGMHIVSLEGEGNEWEGYMIITDENDNRAGTFHLKAIDSIGTTGTLITEGKLFLVDTTRPDAPENFEASLDSDGDIDLEWYYYGEPVTGFNIYRATKSGVEYIDFYASTDGELRYEDNSVNDKVTYYYKIAAVDMAGNIGKMSDEVHTTALNDNEPSEDEVIVEEEEEPKVLPPELVTMVEAKIKEIHQFEIDIDTLISNFEDYPVETKEMVNELNIISRANQGKANAKKIITSLEGMKLHYKTLNELMDEFAIIDSQVNEIKKITPKEISILERADFIQSISDEDISGAINLVFDEMDDKDKKKYTKNILKIQEEINVEASVKVVNTVFMDESSKDQTFVDRKVVYLKPDTLKEIIIVEDIPTSFALSKEIEFQTANHDRINEETVRWGFMKLNFDGQHIKYLINKKVNVNDANSIKTVLLIAPAILESDTKIVGYSILPSMGDLSGFEKFSVYFGVVLVILLLGYYMVFVKDVSMAKERVQGLFKKKKSSSIDFRSIELMRTLLDRTHQHVSREEFDKAASLYPQVQKMYSVLPRDVKKKVYPECVTLQKTIHEGNTEKFDSMF